MSMDHIGLESQHMYKCIIALETYVDSLRLAASRAQGPNLDVIALDPSLRSPGSVTSDQLAWTQK